MYEQNFFEGLIKDLTSLPFLSLLALAIGDATGIIPPWLSLTILLSLLFGGYYILSAIDRGMGGAMIAPRAFEIAEDLVSTPFVLLLAAFVGVVAGLMIVSAYIVMREHDERAGGRA